MTKIIYIYDVIRGKQTNPRRVRFSKELYGYKYSWETSEGLKTAYKKGIVSKCKAEKVGDSAILVEEEDAKEFDTLFMRYMDIIRVRKFRVLREESII
ncbi:MAG: hypothetical protein ACTSSJ_05205 [Candidatus Odinarchaeia archaeon]